MEGRGTRVPRDFERDEVVFSRVELVGVADRISLKKSTLVRL